MKKNVCLLVLLTSATIYNYSLANQTSNENSTDKLAVNLFNLFKEGNGDSIISKYFLSREECEKFSELLLTEKLAEDIDYKYESMSFLVISEMKRQIEILSNHNTNVKELKWISLETLYIDNTIFNSKYKDKLLFFRISCKDQNDQLILLTIGPLVKSDNRWKVYITEFNWRQQ